jgi:hypothetical protein
MDRYDEMIESERDYEAEDYFFEQDLRNGVETKEKQIALCWDMKRGRYFSEYP